MGITKMERSAIESVTQRFKASTSISAVPSLFLRLRTVLESRTLPDHPGYENKQTKQTYGTSTPKICNTIRNMVQGWV